MNALARNSNPATSHAAASAISGSLPELEKKVFNAITSAGSLGMTLDEITQATGLDKVTASPRMRPLCNKGLVVENGTRPGRAGRNQTVWVVM
jgi:hypothetical protein